ncbi:MAG: nucleotidyltransferase family protein [Oscillospiraceae bacterium]
MKIAGIVAEYNPFHNGHLYQIDKTRLTGATHIVAVMSGSFVQRGDIAIFSKWARAKAAILNGADLVIELPVQYALASANRFAKASIFILDQLKVNMISFGSECGDVSMLKETARLSILAESSDLMSECLSKGMSYPRALEEAITELYGYEYSKVIANPNNLLGIEYIKAINEINDKIESFTVIREQVEHDSNSTSDTISSASYMRELIEKADYEQLFKFSPKSAYDIYMSEIKEGIAPVLESRIETVILYKLRMMTLQQFSTLPDVNEGLENRLYRASRTAISLNEFYSLVKTKRYTLARIRRIVYSALIGITAEDTKISPQYIRVLATNKRGMEIIANAKAHATIPISPKFANLYKKSPVGIEFDITATNIASLASPQIGAGNGDFFNNTIVIK